MDFERQALFFFSAIGAFNGLFLSAYFAFFIKNKKTSNYFLAALLFVVSVRVTKSVFLTFYPGTSSFFIQVGLTACLLIGPFLFLYVDALNEGRTTSSKRWLIHVIPVIILMVVLYIYFPYWEHKYLWQRRSSGYMGWALFIQWFAYIVAAFVKAKESFKKLFSPSQKVSTSELWMINMILGVSVIWTAYFTVNYTSYIVGALSFSFTFYVSALIWFFKRRNNTVFFNSQEKYAKKKILNDEADSFQVKLSELFKERELYKNSELKISDVANELGVSTHYLSQYLNDNMGTSFSNYINRYRVHAAEKMLKTNDTLTLEAIGSECGFKSNSTFYAAFKKHNGLTPARYKKQAG